MIDIRSMRKVIRVIDTKQADAALDELEAVFRLIPLALGIPEDKIKFNRVATPYSINSSFTMYENSTELHCTYDDFLEHPFAEICDAKTIRIWKYERITVNDVSINCQVTLDFPLPEEERNTLWDIGKIGMRSEPAHPTLLCR